MPNTDKRTVHKRYLIECVLKLDNKHLYDHVPKSFATSYDGKVSILWSQQVRTNTTVPNNKPDIIIRDDKKRKIHVNRCRKSWRQKCD